MAAGSVALTGGYAAWPGYARRWWILGASCLLAVALGTSPSVAALLTPTTPDVFGVTSLTVQLTVNVTQLVVVAFVLFGGAIGDLFGRRRFLLIGSVGFVVTGVLTAAAPNQAIFVVGRALMGLFSALMLPLAVSVLRITFPPRQLARPLGIYTAIAGLAQLGGPLLTQLFHTALTWRVAFVLPILCGAVGGELARRVVPESSAEGDRRRVEAVTTVAWAGVVLAVMFAISAPTAGRYAARYLIAGLAIAVVATLVLIVSSVQTQGNALGRSVPNKRALAVAIVAGVVLSLAVGGVLLQITTYLTTIARYGPVRMILTISPLGPGILVGGLLAGRLTRPLGARTLISAGLALMGLALVGIAFISPTISYWWLILPFFLFGLGFNAANTCVLDTILSLGVGRPRRGGCGCERSRWTYRRCAWPAFHRHPPYPVWRSLVSQSATGRWIDSCPNRAGKRGAEYGVAEHYTAGYRACYTAAAGGELPRGVHHGAAGRNSARGSGLRRSVRCSCGW